MKKLFALAGSFALVLASFTPATAAEYNVNQKTLSAFAASATTLTASQKAQVKAAVDANPDAEKFICTGIRFASQPMSENIKVRARAKAACAYAKELNPALSTFFQNKPTNARSYAGKVLLTIKSPVGPAPSIELDDYDPASVSKIALAKIEEYYESVKNSEKVAFEIKAVPNVSQAQIDTERERLKKSAQFWGSTYSYDVIAFVYTGDDVDWMVGELNKLGNYFHDNLIRNEQWKRTGECAQSLAVHTAAQPYYINCQRSTFAERRMSSIAAHEFAHLPITSKFLNQPGGVFSTTPVWMNEGGAELFGIALTPQAIDSGITFWHKLHMRAANSKYSISTTPQPVLLDSLLTGITAEESIEFMTQFEKFSGGVREAAYSMGLWATELLIAAEGVEGYLKFLDGMNSSTDWKASFQKTYGVSVTEFYRLMAPYLNYLAEKH